MGCVGIIPFLLLLSDCTCTPIFIDQSKEKLGEIFSQAIFLTRGGRWRFLDGGTTLLQSNGCDLSAQILEILKNNIITRPIIIRNCRKHWTRQMDKPPFVLIPINLNSC